MTTLIMQTPREALRQCECSVRWQAEEKVIVTPGLIELGEREYDCNFALGKAAEGVCDEIILVGKKRSEPLLDGVKSRL